MDHLMPFDRLETTNSNVHQLTDTSVGTRNVIQSKDNSNSQERADYQNQRTTHNLNINKEMTENF